jgi:hypothetical protein
MYKPGDLDPTGDHLFKISDFLMVENMVYVMAEPCRQG